MEVALTLPSDPGQDLHALLLKAAKACSETTQGAVGVLELDLAPSDGDPLTHLSVEAEFAYQDGRRIIDGLDLRARGVCSSEAARDALLVEGLGRFGGKAFTNLCASRPGTDGVDITVSFASRVPFWSEQLLLAADAPSHDELTAFEEILGALGVRASVNGWKPAGRRHTIRSPVTTDMQRRAFALCERHGLAASLYTSTLPASQAFRFEVADPSLPLSVDVVLSRGLTASRICTAADAAEMAAFIERHFGFQIGAHRYRARNCIAQARPAREPVFRGHQRKRGGLLGALR